MHWCRSAVGQPQPPPHWHEPPDWQPQLHPVPQPHAPSSASRATYVENFCACAVVVGGAIGDIEDIGELGESIMSSS